MTLLSCGLLSNISLICEEPLLRISSELHKKTQTIFSVNIVYNKAMLGLRGNTLFVCIFLCLMGSRFKQFAYLSVVILVAGFFLFPNSADAAIARVQQTSGSATTNPVSATWTSSTTSGNLLVAQIVTASDPGLITPPAGGWTLIDTIINANYTKLYYIQNAAAQSGSQSWAITGDTSATQLIMAEYSGVATSGALDQYSTVTGVDTTLTTPTVNTTTADQLLIGVFGNGSTSESFSSPTNSFSIYAQGTVGSAPASSGAFVDRIVSSTGSYSAGVTGTGGSAWGSIIATFKAASSTSSISGTVYTDEGTTNIGANKTVAVSINGAAAAGTDDTDSDGAYSITGLTVSAGDVLTLYVDGETEKGVTVTKGSGSNLTGINIFQNYLITRCDNSCSLTNTNLDTADGNGDADISSIYSVSGGATTTASGKSLYIPASNTYAPGGNVTVAGTFTNAGTYTTGTETLSLTGTSSYNFTPGSTIYNVTINGSGGTYTLQGNLTTSNNLTITAGTLDVSGSNYSISAGGNWSNAGTFTKRSGTVTLTSTSGSATLTSGGSSFYNLTQNGSGGTYTLQDALTVSNNLTITAGTLDAGASNYAITIGGGLTNSGTLTTQSNTVTLNGTNQSITGSSTFYNLTKTVSSAATLTINASSTQTVTGTLTLGGALGQLLTLVSSSPATQWIINPSGTRTVSYLDVRDSNNANATAIDCTTGCTNSGNNTNWNFGSSDTTAPTVSSLSPSNTATGVSPSSDFVITFSESVSAVSGKNITIKKFSDDSTLETIAADNSKVTISENVVTIKPSPDGGFQDLTLYYIVIDSGAFIDAASNAYAGIGSREHWSFTIADTTTPTVLNVRPLNNATGVARTANLVITFNETVQRVSGKKINIKRVSDNKLFEAITVQSGKVTGSGTSIIVVNPAKTFDAGTGYYVLIDSGAFTDTSGNAYAGVSSSLVWSFTTQGTASNPTPTPTPVIVILPLPTPTPDITPVPTPDPTNPDISPTPVITPCFSWDILCTTPTPEASPEPSIVPEPSVIETPSEPPIELPPIIVIIIDIVKDVVDTVEKVVAIVKKAIVIVKEIVKSPATGIPKAREALKPVVHSPAVKATAAAATAIAVVGVAASSASVVASSASIASTTTSMSSLLNEVSQLLSKMWEGVLSFLGFRRKKRPWGRVVDAESGDPVAGVYIQVYDHQSNQLKGTMVSNDRGSFSSLVPPGSYEFRAQKQGWALAPQAPYLRLVAGERVYDGKPVTVTEGKLLPLVLAMRLVESVPLTTHVIWRRTLQSVLLFIMRLSWLALIIGTVLSSAALFVSPTIINMLIEALYVLLIIWKIILHFIIGSAVGYVRDAATNKPIDLALIRVHDALTGRLVETRTTGRDGKFLLLPPAGVYTLTVVHAGYEPYRESHVVVDRKKESLALSFSLKASAAEDDSRVSGKFTLPGRKNKTK